MKEPMRHPESAGLPASPPTSVPAAEVDLIAEAQRLRTALEDIVALANSAAESRARAILMQRRAIAALAGKDEPPPNGSR